MNQPKKFYLTSEWWLTAVAASLGFAVNLGLLDTAIADDAGDNLGMVIKGVFGLWAIVQSVAYTWSRTKVKTSYDV